MTSIFIVQAEAATAQDVECTVTTAKEVFLNSSKRTASQHDYIIRKASATTLADAIGEKMAIEQGKPLPQSVGEAVPSCNMMDYYAAESVRIEGTINLAERPNFRPWTSNKPI
jgi:succinate-semialdehyde dehydrogenase/glutarate-semialdehyde dehydrogenase